MMDITFQSFKEGFTLSDTNVKIFHDSTTDAFDSFIYSGKHGDWSQFTIYLTAPVPTITKLKSK